MPLSTPATELDRLNRSLNSFATQSFRDQADRDYIAARLACRFELFPQFLWSSQQAIEKYLKAILLYNRIKATKIGHDIEKAMELTKSLPFALELSNRSQPFITHVARCGEYRYIDVPYYVHGHLLIDLDLTVWEIRRYCQVLAAYGITQSPEEQVLVTKAKAAYGARKRSTVRVKHHLHAQNPMLYLYPEMLDELLKFAFIPRKLEEAYRNHLASIEANPQSRP